MITMNKNNLLLIQFIKIMSIVHIVKECLLHVFLLSQLINKVTAERHIPKCKDIFNRPKPP